ncbi:MAG: methyltransferase domain-containing protein [Cyanobacteriota bacterium]|nr:methyltransferase domain-containing protein [Cyanobacteriota bacterium]
MQRFSLGPHQRTRLHIGCGLTYLDGWTNCDGGPSSLLFSRLPGPLRRLLRRSGLLGKGSETFWRFLETHPITYVNALKEWPFASGSVDIIYSCHLIDCFRISDVRVFFQHAYRVLKPGGQIRIAGMDLALEVQRYLNNEDAERLAAAVSFPHPQEGSVLSRLKRAIWPPILYRAHLDFVFYKQLLTELGFEGVVQLRPGETTIAHLEPVHLWQRHGESLYVEARKPCKGQAGDAGTAGIE